MVLRRRKNIVRKFAGDEDGAVMILTVILMMLLVKVMFSTYNVGVLTAERMRLQMVTDTAAYSSAVWQARFLNHCAYTRRAIIANYANVALFTAMVSNKEGWDFYEDEDPNAYLPCHFYPSIDPDDPEYSFVPTPRMSIEVLGPIYDFTAMTFSDDESARNTAEALAQMHAVSQEVMYAYVSRPWTTIVPPIVQASNQPVNGRKLIPIEIDEKYLQWAMLQTISNRPGMLNESFIRKVNLTHVQKDIEARFDRFTQPHEDNMLAKVVPALQDSIPNLVSRPFHAYDLLFSYLWTYPSPCAVQVYPCILPRDIWFVTSYNSNSSEMEVTIEESNGEFSTTDYITFYPTFSPTYYPPFHQMKYFNGWQWAWTPWTGFFCIPVFSMILDSEEWESEYSFMIDPGDLEFYDLQEDLDPAQMEPSVYVVLKMKRDELVGEASGMFDGKLFHNKGMPLANQVRDMRAISRAKVYFQPRWTNNFYEPNLYYPYWEAQLAPIFGPSFMQSNSTLKTNSLSLLTYVDPEAAPDAYRIYY